jgi:C1A family cysteine protease
MNYKHSSKHTFINGKHRHIKGWRPSPPDHRDLIMPDPTLVPGLMILPSAADNSNLCSPVEDQGELGSCTANSSTSAMEALAKKLGIPVINLSRLFVYYYSRKVEGTPPSEDSGAVIRDVMKVLAHYGAPPETAWPYDIEQFSSNPPYPVVKAALTHRINRYYRCPTLHSIKVSLAHGFTAVGGFSVPESMMGAHTAQTGIVAMPGPHEAMIGGHAVHFVAYDDSTRLLKFQNSWGAGWGAKGFGFLPYDFVDAKLADDFWSIRRET